MIENKTPMQTDMHTRALAALESGNKNEAYTHFGAILSSDPSDIDANYYLGVLNLEDRKAKIALPLLQKAAKLSQKIKPVRALGNCFEALARYSDATNCYRAVLKKTPRDGKLWVQYGRVLERDNQKDKSIEAYQKALSIEPDNAEAAIKLGWLLWKDSPILAIQTLEKALSANKKNKVARIQLLSTLIVFQEWSARLQLKKSPYHALDLKEMFFPLNQITLKKLYSESHDFLKLSPTIEWAQMTAGLAAFSSQKYVQSQKLFSKIEKGHLSPMAKAIRLDQGFYNQLDQIPDSDLSKNLAPVQNIITMNFKDKNIIYMACNSHYFDAFAKPLLISMNEQSPKGQVHAHIMDSSPKHTEEARRFCHGMANLEVALSIERPKLSLDSSIKPREYFHAIRFIRFFNHLKYYKKSLWLMDVDGLFNKPPHTIFEKHSTNDIVLRARPGRLEPWNQFNACLVGAHYSELALRYLKFIAKYIYYYFQKGSLPWGIDQLAMYATYINLLRASLEPTIQLLDEQDLDYDHIDSSTLWCSSGTKKFMFFNNMETINYQNLSAYEKKFLNYFKQTKKL